VVITDLEVDTVNERRERLVEEIRAAERARGQLAGLERRLEEKDRSDLENHLARMDRLGGVLSRGPHRAAVGRVRCLVRKGARRRLCRFRCEQVALEDRGEDLDTQGQPQPPRRTRPHGRLASPNVVALPELPRPSFLPLIHRSARRNCLENS